MSTKLLAFGAAILVGGCALQRNDIDVGSNDAGRVEPGPDDTEACRNGPQLPIVGRWEGYIENFKLESGSDVLRVAVSSATSAQVCGKVTLGTAAPAVPTDPNVGYPSVPWHQVEFDNRTLHLTEGFPMTILEGSASSTRLRFAADWRELWKSWCQLQTAFLEPVSGRYLCVSSTSVTASPDGCFLPDGTGEPVRVDCGKVALCIRGACACTQAGCSVQSAPVLSFDFRISGDEASGSANIAVSVPGSGIHNVYLTRSR